MKITSKIVGGYGILVLIGGIMGHVQANSSASLVAGILFGLALLLSAWGLYKETPWGQYTALVLTFCLDGFFTYRFAKTLQFIPSGLMSLLSLAVLIVIALKIKKNLSNS